ncbi:hypothetical protein PAXRUDRAFT_11402 [Paxillus rubicundulus Ve08.2h10]|uniref:Uncharacterized protein n=1 Tax=Paxillus rubicundulus Ve08.2h10 TaxID=930991 RepID=A0A0D0E982_9AGAM|nr:hypothetical protein PAXRUDRAFT_11402 [Paxillus rubicundulus Ve08.2h10]
MDSRHSWAMLSKGIERWLVNDVQTTSIPQWAWDRDTFWLAYVATYPTFPNGTQQKLKTSFVKNSGKNSPQGDSAEPSRTRVNPYSLGISAEHRRKGKSCLKEAFDFPPESSTPETEEEFEQTEEPSEKDPRPPSPIDVEPTMQTFVTFTKHFDNTMSEKATEIKVGTPTNFDGNPNNAS